MRADILREKFLDFFKNKGHRVIESDSLVPKEDPTVLFTPAGMNQFKKEFLGFSSGSRRAATSQRCLRTDDLDKVGKTPSHHTFFEMLGNFSFGDYFKEEAIVWAWEFLTKDLKIKKEKLSVSVYKDDLEAYKIWKDKIKIPENRILKLGDKENFWPAEAREKGPNGPCGPCSEIFFNHKKGQVEIWNLVFTQFNRKEGARLEPLPKKNIDTGMGLERLTAVMQGVYSNFETDLFAPIIKEIISEVNKSPRLELVYTVADHIRAIVFAIYDGVLPANEGRGYVVRKLIRKSRMHLWALGIKKPYLYKLVPEVSQVMQVPYPQLPQRRENIAEIILAEEENFISTFNSSDKLFAEKFSGLLKKEDPQEAGRIAFQLYDTYGIPLELTLGWLKKNAIQFSAQTFNSELGKQKTRSKLKSKMKGEVFAVGDLYLGIKETKFLGYQDYTSVSKILRIVKDEKQVKKIVKGEKGQLILDKTPFYPESGGQIGDAGELKKGKNLFVVSDTCKSNKVILHIGRVGEGTFKVGDFVSANIDVSKRLSLARNHTASHLLQAVLRKVLGAHVQQQGSLVAEERLRFDFTHFKDIDKGQLQRIEEMVNSAVINNYHLNTKVITLSEAQKQGALAFFAEKYEGKVRVVSIDNVSKEVCGGTHLSSTGAIGYFKITTEGSVASGIRRIEAVTGHFAYKLIKEEKYGFEQELSKKSTRIKELEKQLNLQRADTIKESLDSLIQNAAEINGIKVITQKMENVEMDTLRKTVDLIKGKVSNTIIALGAANQEKALLVMGVTEDLCRKGFSSQELISSVAKIIGGSGGGRPDFAQAGGNNPENFEKAFQELQNIIQNKGL